MAKIFFIIVCVCYCTTCIHLTSANIRKIEQQHPNNDNNINEGQYKGENSVNDIGNDRVKRHSGDNSHGSNINLDNFVEMNPNTLQFIKKL